MLLSVWNLVTSDIHSHHNESWLQLFWQTSEQMIFTSSRHGATLVFLWCHVSGHQMNLTSTDFHCGLVDQLLRNVYGFIRSGDWRWAGRVQGAAEDGRLLRLETELITVKLDLTSNLQAVKAR